MNEVKIQEVVTTLQNGGVVVIRTDTLYGIIALANNQSAVEKVYSVKHRDPRKQCIILLDEAPDDAVYKDQINHYSRDASFPTSVIVPATIEPEWVLRGGTTVAYRVVRDDFLKEVVRRAGPVIAPSANPEGKDPARTIEEAKAYFGAMVDYYVDGGEVPASVQASQIIQVADDGTITTVRGSLRQQRSAGGLVFHDDKVLLIHWDPPRSSYDFPKGGLESSETSEQAAVREVLEETGYHTRIIAPIGQTEYDFQTPNGEWRHKTNEYFLLELTDETPQQPDKELYETFEHIWVPIDQAEALLTRDINKDIFNKALKLR